MKVGRLVLIAKLRQTGAAVRLEEWPPPIVVRSFEANLLPRTNARARDGVANRNHGKLSLGSIQGPAEIGEELGFILSAFHLQLQ